MRRSTREEVIRASRERYSIATRAQKTRILDHLVGLTGYHRKYLIRRLLGKMVNSCGPAPPRKRERIYNLAVKEALLVLWETSDRICSKRLKASIPILLDSMERFGHLSVDPMIRTRLLQISPSTIDRLLSPHRSNRRKRKKRRAKNMSSRVPTRTFSDWGNPGPGYLEIDFVAHCGGSMKGRFIHTLVGTDVCTGWTEFVPLIAREQTLVVEGLKKIMRRLPFPLKGLDSDNDSAFINETLVAFCQKNGIEFTRSRPYRKNDQAWVEQKNGAVIRRIMGHGRLSGIVACQAMTRLFQSIRLYVNYFQPSFKLRHKERQGGKISKSYFPPETPCNRVINCLKDARKAKMDFEGQMKSLDPVRLLYTIREGQAAIQAISTNRSEMASKDFSRFLKELPNMWKRDEVRPTHMQEPSKERWWRTRQNPYESVWPEILLSLEQNPDIPAKELFLELQAKYPGQFQNGQLRTLQRRVREWRRRLAKELVFG